MRLDRIPSRSPSPLDALLANEAPEPGPDVYVLVWGVWHRVVGTVKDSPTTSYGRTYCYPYGRRWRTVEVEFDATPRQVETVSNALVTVEQYIRSRRKGAVVACATAHRILAHWIVRDVTSGDGKGPETPLDLARRFRVTVPRVRALLAAFERYRKTAAVPDRDEAFDRLKPFRKKMNRRDNR